MFTCAVTDYVEPDLDWERDVYASSGINFRADSLRDAGERELIAFGRGADVLVVDQARITRAVLAGLAQCKLVIRHGDGYDNVDVAAATEFGIAVANKPGFWSREVAELALTLSLSLLRRVPDQQQVARTAQEGRWRLTEAMPQRGLSSRTVGVLGYGRIGRQAARLFRDVVGSVIVHDPYADQDEIREAGFEAVSFERLLDSSDLITIHVPATQETIGLFGERTLARMRYGAFLVNTARGAVVDTTALVSALECGRMGGAALDTTSPEPLDPGHPLLSMTNVIVTPHLGWYSEDALWKMRRSIAADVQAMAKNGQLPETLVNPKVLESPAFKGVEANR